MKVLILFLYFALVVIMAIATFVEYGYGTPWVTGYVYHSAMFAIIWAVLALLMIRTFIRLQIKRRIFSFLLHLSFVVILLGAAVSSLTSQYGFLHLRVGASSFQYIEQETHLLKSMPFRLRLDSFWVKNYPGTETHANYVSRVTCLAEGKQEMHSAEISMNNVFKYRGYRFYQASYDMDGLGSCLGVSYDPWGTSITYIGYLLFTFSMLGVLFCRKSVFWRLLHHPALKRGVIVGVMCLVGTSASYASSMSPPVISETVADSLSCIQIIYHGRVVPFNTLACDFVKKLSGKDEFNGLMPEQVVGSWLKYPEEWKYVPIITVDNALLRHYLKVGESAYVCLADLKDSEFSRLRDSLKIEMFPMAKSSALEKAVMEADEKVALVSMLLEGTLVTPIPMDGSVKPLSSLQVKSELLYNSVPFSKILFIFNLALGFLSLGWILYGALRKKQVALTSFMSYSLLLSLLFHAFGYVLRWYIGGRIPLSNGYETMQFMALSVLALAYLLRKRLLLVVPFAFLFSGFILLVSHLGQMNPQITSLIPVLVSPWLSTHVSFIMISYTFFAFMALNGLLGLCLPREAERLMLFSRLLLYPGMFFWGVGIFIGAVWANVSWGCYWSWDPKEVWALITMMMYGMAFHIDSFPLFRRPMFYHIYMLVAFLSVLMTYFGVNFLLGGMHSYV